MAESQRAPTCLLVLCGLPGAGKTSLARGLQTLLGGQGCDQLPAIEVVHVCFDELGCHPSTSTSASSTGDGGGGGFSPSAWRSARQAAFAALECALKGGAQSPAETSAAGAQQKQQQQQQQELTTLHRRRLVVADDNMQYRSMRQECLALARGSGACLLLLHLACSTQAAQLRNAARTATEQVPEEALARMAAVFEAPATAGSGGSSSRGGPPWWEQQHTIKVDAEQLPLDAAAVWQQVWAAWGAPLPPPLDPAEEAAAKAAAQQATAASVLHGVDLACRHAISEHMQQSQGMSQQQRSGIATQLNTQRKQLLADVKQQQQQQQTEALEATVQRWLQLFRQRCSSSASAVLHMQQC